MNEGIRKYDLFIFLVSIICVFVLTNFILVSFHNNFLNSYWTKPVLWGLLALVVYKLPGYRTYGIYRARYLLIFAATALSVLQIIALVAAGIFEGFGRSPYSFTPLGIVINIFYVYLPLAGMELGRSWLINRCFKRNSVSAIFWATLIFTLLAFPVSIITGVKTMQGVVRFVGEIFLPTFAENLLASLLAFLGGPVPAIIYRGIIQLFLWFSPLLPNLQWTTQSLIGVAFPALGFAFVQWLYSNAVCQVKKSAYKKENPTGWIIVSLISVFIIWFPTGLLGVYPSVIISGSMKPGINIGDMVIVKKLKPEEVKKGDIIQYLREDKKVVTHRVLNVVKNDSGPHFITKGDANHIYDDPVKFQNLKGKMIAKIPKIGLVSLAIRTMFSEKQGFTGKGVNK